MNVFDPFGKNEGDVKTVMDCTECHKQFVALLNFSVTGNHVIECPHCGHEHCRVIENGQMTEIRWDSRYGSDSTRDGIRARRVWKSSVLPAATTSASEFMREKWLERFTR